MFAQPLPIRTLLTLAAVATGLSACATSTTLPPAEAIRYHLGQPIPRGTVRVEPVTGGGAPASLEFRAYADAVSAELTRNGYTPAAPGAQPEFIAAVGFRRGTEMGPPRQSPVSIGIGGGGFGGGRRGGGVGLGGGIGFPIGGGQGREIVMSEINVTIKRRADQSPIWEGSARGAADAKRPEAGTTALAQRLAAALFLNFPGESGRTVELR